MTANQIQYWKLQEDKRHNIEMENMERPYKESATLLNYESIETAPTVRALNLAGAADHYASATRNYAEAELAGEKSATERTVQAYNEARTAGVNLSNESASNLMPESELAGMYATDILHYYDFATTKRQNRAGIVARRETWGIGDTSSAAKNYAQTMAMLFN